QAALLLDLPEGIRADLDQAREGAGALPESVEDLRDVRTPDVLPQVRVRPGDEGAEEEARRLLRVRGQARTSPSSVSLLHSSARFSASAFAADRRAVRASP